MVNKLYMDEHIPSPITRGLRGGGIDVVTVQEDSREGEDVEPLLERATSLGRILVTMDRDFETIVARRQAAGRHFSGVVICAHGIAYRAAIDDLE